MRFSLAVAALTASVLFSAAPGQADAIRNSSTPQSVPKASGSGPKSIEGTKSSGGGIDGGIKSAPIEPVTVRFPTKK